MSEFLAIANSLEATTTKAEQDWRFLSERYLPVRSRNLIWRMSRTRGRDDPPQGWKLHVSATILSACDICRSVAPYLKRRRILFKATRSLAELMKLNSGAYGFSQVGKFITVYPPSGEAAVAIALKLHALTAKFAGPIIPFDNRLQDRSLIYYRYGSFSNVSMTFRGRRVSAIRRPDGKLVPDQRKPGAAVPAWVTDPFRPPNARTEFVRVTALETDYTDYEALVQRGRGGVYRAQDISSGRSRPCIIKEGRRHGETDWWGRDGFDRIKREAQFLQSTSTGVAALPRVLATFHANSSYYLVMEHVNGRSLQEVINSRERISRSRLLRYCASMAQIVAEIHAAGWAWRDCKPANFLCGKNGRLRAIDFEGSCRLYRWRTNDFKDARLHLSKAAGKGQQRRSYGFIRARDFFDAVDRTKALSDQAGCSLRTSSQATQGAQLVDQYDSNFAKYPSPEMRSLGVLQSIDPRS